MEVFLWLVARTDHEHQLGRADVKAHDAAGRAQWDVEFAKGRPGLGE